MVGRARPFGDHWDFQVSPEVMMRTKFNNETHRDQTTQDNHQVGEGSLFGLKIGGSYVSTMADNRKDHHRPERHEA